MCKSAETPVCESHVPFGATIRYLLIAVHRRDVEQSSVSRFHLIGGGQGAGMQCHISSLHSNTREYSLILGAGGMRGGDFLRNFGRDS